LRRGLPLLLVACAGGAPPPEPQPQPAPATPPAHPERGGDAAESKDPDAAPVAPSLPRIELTFMGDVAFGGRFRSGNWSPMDVPANDPFAAVASLIASDLPIANLETTVMTEVPAPEGKLRFVATPDQVALLPKNGIPAVTIANNHIGDVDKKGIVETLQHLADLGLTVFGAPREEEPLFRAETIEIKGWRIAVVAATARLNRRQKKGRPQPPFLLDEKLPPALIPVIEAARPGHDLVVVVLHWGTEYADAPHDWQIEAAHAFVDAGADVVVGHHPHVLQGIERYKGAVIAYSLGNFVFQNATEPEKWTGILRLGFAADGDRRCLDLAAFHPTEMQRSPFYHPLPAAGRALDATVARLTELSEAMDTAWTLEGDRVIAPAACP
jgi:poly-gamma-glutamate synthesis protein (capsule biosynthesis protein)